MKEIITIINQKGGVGKSTTAQNFGSGLILKGYKVLFIDLDAQGNLSHTMKCNTNPASFSEHNSANNTNQTSEHSTKCNTNSASFSEQITIFDLLTEDINPLEAIQKTKAENGYIVESSQALAGADTFLTATGKEYRLKEILESVHEMFDYIIIDTPPALGVLTINALTASTGAIIPAQADIYSLQGISQLNKTIKIVKQYCNPNLKIKGILLTRYSSRAILSKDMAEMLNQTAEQLNSKLYNTKIRECIAIKEAQASQQTIFNYAPKSNAAIDYKDFTEEVLEIENQNQK